MQKKKAFVVATAHLDTVWRWNLAKTIQEYIPDTLNKNFHLLEKYPHYRFNFEGAFRYELIEEYYPKAFEMIKQYAKEGRWCLAGASYENGDVNIPSPEALFRNILLGNNYFKEKFNKTTKDIFLPDCFGFGWALPSVMKHAGLKGFITQKLSWEGAYGRPFDLGIWEGVNGSRVYASIDARSYRYQFSGDIRADLRIIEKIAKNAFDFGLPWTLNLYGTGDRGGSPTEESVLSVNDSVIDNKHNDFQIISAQADEIFDELDALPDSNKEKLPVWKNELVLTNHGAGGYTSRCMSKRLNRKNELFADRTERACVTAEVLGVYQYPKENLNKAWKRVIRHQFHDDIPGTSIMKVYHESWNDYFVSLSQFKNEYCGAVSAIANELDTSWITECALIVNNPVAKKRTDAVEAHVKLNHNATFLRVVDQNGNEVPSQVLNKAGKEFDIVFLATVDSLGYRVYDVKAANTSCSIKTDLSVSEHMIENSKYRLVFNRNGDIASLIDKRMHKQLLDSPIKMALLQDTGALSYPSWEIRKKDLDKEPYAFANTPEFEILESGPARAAIKITREAGYSRIEQVVSLTADSEYVKVDNFVDWQSRRTMLKAVFPFSAYNKKATYDLGLGVIDRSTNQDHLYEVPAQKWADITAGSGAFGVSVFSDCKYGWDKPSANTLRLTCIHTPAGAFTKETRQDLQDIGRNIFGFGIYSHNGGYENGTQISSELFSQPMTAFQSSARRDGALGSSFSFAEISSDNVLIRAIKQEENGNAIILRVNEAAGKLQKKVSIRFFEEILSADETLANEEVLKQANHQNHQIIFDMEPFAVKTFKIILKPQKKKGAQHFHKLDLDYNTKGITPDHDMKHVILQGAGCSLPAELLPPAITVGGTQFKLPNSDGRYDIMVTRGQILDLPKGDTKLYLLAASTLGDREVSFYVDNKERKFTVHALTEPVGRWDMAGLKQTAKVKDAAVAIEFTHTHHPEGNKAGEKAYFFLYEIDIRNGKKLTLPEDNRIVILAMTAVKKFSNTSPAFQLIDSAEESYQFGDIPPIDKIIDKADFATIRAGKIQDQMNNGKGKGLKRDNIITNIIRSYTKSEW